MIALPAGHLTEMVGLYVAEKTGMDFEPGMYQALMVVNDAQDFVAGIVFTNYRGANVEVSCATETPMAWRKGVCKAIANYVFVQLDCVRATCITTKGNRKARAFLKALGFELEGNVRLGYDGRRDALLYGILRSECRFLPGEGGINGKQNPSGTSSTGPGSNGASPIEGEHGRRDFAGQSQSY